MFTVFAKAIPPDIQKRTQWLFVGTKLLISPLEAMYMLLVYIASKDLHATPLQLTLFASLKPITALLSFYGNLMIKGRPYQLKWLIFWSTILSFVPCFFFPFIHNVWFFLFAYALFMMSARAMIPAWSEILKINLPQELRGKVFSQGAIAMYLTNIVFPLFISFWLDYYTPIWRWIFMALALVQLVNLILIFFIELHPVEQSSEICQPYQLSSPSSVLLGPWKNCWNLMSQHADFRNFQIVFMLGGGGLMLMHPVLTIFFRETLHLSYTQLSFATLCCKGVGFVLTSSLWARWFHRISIHSFNFCVTLLCSLFALLVVGSQIQLYCIYGAYLIYGTMQAGSELSWHLSGPIFSNEKDSTLFTGVNVAMVGLRGCLAPFLGQMLFLYSNAISVFFCGGLICLVGSLYSLWLSSVSKEKALSVKPSIASGIKNSL